MSKRRKRQRHKVEHVRPVQREYFVRWFGGDDVEVHRLLGLIDYQEQLERLQALWDTATDMPIEEREAMARLLDATAKLLNLAYFTCPVAERVAFDRWRSSGPEIREAGKAVLTDRRHL